MEGFIEMNRSLFYCKSWFRAKKRPTEIWTEEQAKTAHASRTLYTVLVDSVEKPLCFLEINDKFVGVGFLDKNEREYLYYAFKEISARNLFLSMATYREFEADTDKITLGTTYLFSQDNTVKIQKQDFDLGTAETVESSADVRNNYSQWPEFGEYDDLIRIERI